MDGHLARQIRSATLLPATEPVRAEHLEHRRNAITRLVELDGQHGSTELVPTATRLFHDATTQLANGNYPQHLERDFLATAAELGEVAGWLAFDALRNHEARALNRQALPLARLAGDSNMELFLLGNMALHAQETGKAREALRLVQRMERFRLTPRLRALVMLRHARAAADLGDAASFALLRWAQVAVDDSTQRADPCWAWWVDARELLFHEGGMWRAIGQPNRAVDCYAAAVERVPRRYRWASYIGGAGLVSALVEVRAWAEADRAATEVAALAPEVTSARADQRLREASAMARRRGAPSSLDDLLTVLGGTAPYGTSDQPRDLAVTTRGSAAG